MRHRYPIQDLAVGERVVLPWFQDVRGSRKTRPIVRMVAAIRAEQKNRGKRFEWTFEEDGIHVLRVA